MPFHLYPAIAGSKRLRLMAFDLSLLYPYLYGFYLPIEHAWGPNSVSWLPIK